VVRPKFSNSIQNCFFFQFFPFPYGGMAKFFSKFKNKIFNSNFKNDFLKIFPFQNFLVA
jgi:hypothetical protein